MIYWRKRVEAYACQLIVDKFGIGVKNKFTLHWLSKDGDTQRTGYCSAKPVWLEGFQFPVHLSIHPPAKNRYYQLIQILSHPITRTHNDELTVFI